MNLNNAGFDFVKKFIISKARENKIKRYQIDLYIIEDENEKKIKYYYIINNERVSELLDTIDIIGDVKYYGIKNILGVDIDKLVYEKIKEYCDNDMKNKFIVVYFDKNNNMFSNVYEKGTNKLLKKNKIIC